MRPDCETKLEKMLSAAHFHHATDWWALRGGLTKRETDRTYYFKTGARRTSYKNNVDA
jgi:hypothetical protein